HRALAKCELGDDIRLARIINLNGLGGLFEHARNDAELKRLEIVRRWTNYRRRNPKTWTAESGPFDRWLHADLKRRDRMTDGEYEERKTKVVEGVLEILNKAVRDRKRETISRLWELHHPTWATQWSQLQPYLDHDPQRWSQLLGVDWRGLPNRWILLLVYP